jgi:hypothetical protein
VTGETRETERRQSGEDRQREKPLGENARTGQTAMEENTGRQQEDEREDSTEAEQNRKASGPPENRQKGLTETGSEKEEKTT